MEEKITELQQELYVKLKKAEKARKIINFGRILCYGGGVIYFLGLIGVQVFIYSGGDMSLFYTLDPEPTFGEQYKMLTVILPLFTLIFVGGYVLSYFQRKYSETEVTSIKRIIGTMFPGTTFKLVHSFLPPALVMQSNFFGGTDKRLLSGRSFGSITFENNNRKIIFRDVLINTSKRVNWFSETWIGALLMLFVLIFKGLFVKRIENITGDFRGMFADAQLEKKINGSVVVLPDRLERHLDYLAKNIQALKNVSGNKLVILEDVEFERHFAVYASDEITARYVLTPAMMMRMTTLKQKYNRDIMLSFNDDRFFFAVAMPEGFLTLGDASLTSGAALSDLYDNFAAARDILNELRIK